MKIQDGTSLVGEQTNILCMIVKLGRIVPLWQESPSIPPLKGRPALFELPSPGHQTFYRIRVAKTMIMAKCQKLKQKQ